MIKKSLTLLLLYFNFLLLKIDRQNIIARGRLAQLLTEGPSPNPRWLVKFDSQPYKDEEMYERLFGSLIHSNEESEEQQLPSVTPVLANSSGRSKISTNNANPVAANNTNGRGGVSSEGEKSDDTKKGKKSSNSSVSMVTTSETSNSKSVQFERDGTIDSGSNDSSPNEENSDGGKGRYRTLADRVSAREARSRRRQAQIDDATFAPGTEVLTGKRKLLPTSNSKNYKYNEPHYAEDGTVVKVKLLTGTLYLHRGHQRRVEFVRRV